MVMVAAAAGLAKWFGSRRKGDDDGDVPGGTPIVRAMFKAVNEGDLDGFEPYVHEDCRLAINSIELTRDDDAVDRGFALWADAITDARNAFPSVRWDLYDELYGEDDGEEKIAIRFVSTVTADGEEHHFEVAGFGIVEDGKLKEWHQVADQETYDRRRMQTGEQALGDAAGASGNAPNVR